MFFILAQDGIVEIWDLWGVFAWSIGCSCSFVSSLLGVLGIRLRGAVILVAVSAACQALAAYSLVQDEPVVSVRWGTVLPFVLIPLILPSIILAVRLRTVQRNE